MPSLYPTLNLPQLVKPQSIKPSRLDKVAPYFDFATGEFLFDGAGRIIMADEYETFEQWCLKVCMTERYSYLAYSDKIGVELDDATRGPNIEAVQSAIIRTITEAIMVHPAAEYVKNFAFEIEGDNVWVSFDVKAREWSDERRLALYF